MAVDTEANSQAASPFVFVSALILMATALLLGGASRNDPLGWMVVELAGLVVLLAAIWGAFTTRHSASTIAAYAILLLLALIPLVQLAPLPPSWWESLPGREPLVHAIKLAGLTNRWRPISLAPDETQRALLYLLAPAGMFVAVSQCNERQRGWIAVVVLCVGLLSLAVGVLQVVGGGSGLIKFYADAADGLPCGFFANRNHQASFLVCCLALTAALPRLDGLPQFVRTNPAVIFGLMFLFAVGSAATLSRAGILLLPPVAIGAGVIYMAQARAKGRWPALIVFVLATAAALGLIVVLKGGPIWDRFRVGDVDDVRFADFPQIVDIAKNYQPLGSGVGSFDLVFRSHEQLGQLDPFYLNHVHNDYLESWLEAGWPGVALAVTFGLWWIRAVFRAWGRNSRSNFALARTGALLGGALLLHSVVDYPLRTPALSVLFALSSALLCNRNSTASPHHGKAAVTDF